MEEERRRLEAKAMVGVWGETEGFIEIGLKAPFGGFGVSATI